MTQSQGSSWNLGGEGNSFAFDKIGDAVDGLVIDLTERQSTDMETGAPAFWDNGDKKMLPVVTLQTQLRDDAFDDGKRTVALSGSKKPESKSRMAAVVAAVREATGGTSLQHGGRLYLKYSGDGTPTRRGWNPPKFFEAKYQAPAMDLAGAKSGSDPYADGPQPDDDAPPF